MRKLVFGETWQLPLGIAVAVLIAVAVRLSFGDVALWRELGGVLLAVCLATALGLALRRS